MTSIQKAHPRIRAAPCVAGDTNCPLDRPVWQSIGASRSMLRGEWDVGQPLGTLHVGILDLLHLIAPEKEPERE